MKKWIILVALLLLAVPVMAQDVIYQNDQFAVQLPAGWENTSTDRLAQATDSLTGTTFYALTALSVEDALSSLSIEVGDLIETTSVQLLSGEWSQSTYVSGDILTVIWSQAVSMQTHLMIAVAPLSAAERLVPTIEATISSYQVIGRDNVHEAQEPFTYPKPNGAFGVGRVEYVWLDSERDEMYSTDGADKRELVVTVWYPTELTDVPNESTWVSPALASAYGGLLNLPPERFTSIQVNVALDAVLATHDASFPIIVMSHGDGMLPALYTTYAEALASHGYVVFGIAHPYNAAVVVYPDGRIITALPEASAQPLDVRPDMTPLEIVEAIDRQGRLVAGMMASDIRFVLNQIELLNAHDARFKEALDLERIGVLGHSIGGAAAIEALLQDSRIAVAVNLDGTVFSDVVPIDGRGLMTIAIEYVGATIASDTELAGMGLSREEFDQVIAITSRAEDLFRQSPSAYFVMIAGTDHMNFSDVGLLAGLVPSFNDALGTIEPSYALEITNAYVLAFFDQSLRGGHFDGFMLTEAHPESTLIAREAGG
ncbi:MAG: hypothetical protein J0M33_27085 [Anaerolineae bacterium]|nr:hypothetical protein [Anaerolineae bacterium]